MIAFLFHLYVWATLFSLTLFVFVALVVRPLLYLARKIRGRLT